MTPVRATDSTGVVLVVRDRVMFARGFLRSIGAVTGELPFQVGTVDRVNGRVVYVQWDHGGTSATLAANLVRKDRLHLERS
jgi:hypothetical protein